MLIKTHRYSKNSLQEFHREAIIHRQYFEEIRLKTMNFKSNTPQIKEQILQQFDFLKTWTDYAHKSFLIFLGGVLLGGISLYFNIPIIWAISIIGLCLMFHLFLKNGVQYIDALLQNLCHDIQDAESLYKINMLYISHLGLDCAIILQRICNQNSQFADYLKYYHQSEDMLKYHRQDLEDLLRRVKKDNQTITQANVDEKLTVLRKFNQELRKNINLLAPSSEEVKCSHLTQSLLEKSMFFIQKHQGVNASDDALGVRHANMS